MPEEKATLFYQDCLADRCALGRFIEQSGNPEGLVKAWEVLPAGLRTDVPNLEKVSAFQTIRPNSTSLIRTEFANLPSSQHQNFINGLGNVANNDVLSSSLTLNRIPDVPEISTAASRTAQFRVTENVPDNRNLGYVEGNLNGANIQNVDNTVWSSGAADLNTEPQIFQAQEIGWLRNTDSEYKMLNRLAADLGGASGNAYPSITGSLKIVSEQPYCPSCQGVIQQFNTMFPNIEITLIDGIR